MIARAAYPLNGPLNDLMNRLIIFMLIGYRIWGTDSEYCSVGRVVKGEEVCFG